MFRERSYTGNTEKVVPGFQMSHLICWEKLQSTYFQEDFSTSRINFRKQDGSILVLSDSR